MIRSVPTRFACLSLLVLGVVTGLGTEAAAEENWPQWRGPSGEGLSQQNLPVHWSNDDVVWKTALRGRGQSSPVTWGDRIFLTASEKDGAERWLMCLARDDGQVLWEERVWNGAPEPAHSMNPWASATCATDGQRVVAFFGKAGLHCYSVDGDHLWSRMLGDFPGPWGTASSPIIAGDLVIQNCDAEANARLIALDKSTGEVVWQTPRDNLRGWSSPLLVDVGDHQEIVLNGERGVHAYDLVTGKERWFNQGDRGRGSPTVTRYQNLLIAVSGRPGDMFAMRPGGSGTVNATHEVWRTRRTGGRDLPSPIVVGDKLLVFKLRPGLVTSYDAATGKQLDTARLEGNFSASPITANGRVYMPNEDGTVYVIQADRNNGSLEVLASNELKVSDEEVFRASLTPSRGQLLLRSDRTLYCIGAPTGSE